MILCDDNHGLGGAYDMVLVHNMEPDRSRVTSYSCTCHERPPSVRSESGPARQVPAVW